MATRAELEAEVDRRIEAVRAAKDRARANGHISPSARELTEALGDEHGLSQETRAREARRRRRL